MNTRLDTKPSSVEPDWAAIRSRFPVLEKKTYLNSCPYGALASDVIAALQKYINDRLEKGTDWNYWVARNESVRTAVADFLGADTDEVAVPDDAERHGALITLRPHDENALVASLEKQRIVISCRFGNLRISPHFYNNHDDIDTLFRALKRQKHLLI